MRASDHFDDYIDGRMNRADRERFEAQVASDPVLAGALEEHLQLLGALDKQQKRSDLKKQLRLIHEQEFGVNNRVISMGRDENFARRHGKTIVVAASTTLIAVLTTVAALSTGGYLLKKQSNQITNLNREVMELRASSNAIVEGITRVNASKKAAYAPANLEGSAFAINNNGYILTSYHTVTGADSIFVQNSHFDRVSARLVFSDPAIDMAVLKISDENAFKKWDVPFVLQEKEAEIADAVFTLGYPRKDVVYGEGSLSSLSGYFNDTSMYQISIPVNPGNSGGPLLDSQGDVIGVIRGKVESAEGTGFAIKARDIVRSIRLTADDSTGAVILGHMTRKPVLKSLKRSAQIRKINPYVFNVLVYKGN